MGTKNKLSDLNNHLFAQLEKLGEDNLNGEQLTQEIERSKAIAVLAQQIVQNGKLVLEGVELFDKITGDNQGGKNALNNLLGNN